MNRKSSKPSSQSDFQKKIVVLTITIFFLYCLFHKNMFSAGTREGLIIQALKNLGKDHIDKKMYVQIAKLLKDSTEEEIRKNMKFAPAWIRVLVFEIIGIKS